MIPAPYGLQRMQTSCAMQKHLARDLYSAHKQIAFRVASIKEVRAMHDLVIANNVDGIDPVDHGNAWSVYFLDPEGNRLEFFCDTPLYVAQPRRTAGIKAE